MHFFVSDERDPDGVDHLARERLGERGDRAHDNDRWERHWIVPWFGCAEPWGSLDPGTSCAKEGGLKSIKVSGTFSIAPTLAGSAATCSFSGTVSFTPLLTASGGGTGVSSIEATLSGCKTNSGNVEGFGSTQLRGSFPSSPFMCSSSSQTNAVLSAMINWNVAAWPNGGIAPTMVDGPSATGAFPGAAAVNLQVPSDIAAGCARGSINTDSVLGTVTVGPACGEVGDPLSIYPIVPPICGAQAYMPTSITSGPDDALWFPTYNSNLIGRMTTAGVTTLYPAPTGGQGTWGNGGITAGSDGALWFIADSGGAIGRITTSGSTSTFPLPSGSGSAFALTSGPDGALWFITLNTSGPNEIRRLTTSGQFTMFTDPSIGTANWNSADHRFLWDITSGPDGALWFSMWTADNPPYNNQGAWIGTITTSGAVTTYPIPFGAFPTALTAGPDGAIWFGTDGNGVIGRVTTSGVFSEYSGQPGQIGQVLGITAGPEGALWFTNYSVPGDTGYVPFSADRQNYHERVDHVIQRSEHRWSNGYHHRS